ncbi:LOW QUALITY PROTEIN: LEAF RUST 10 DISEASE-RESISTANCE LOCUS RECEPTOR-LIKE PROTEIN KINASE-like 1.2 [Cryptomeria japonica]|uniref:LOW QUALITY PROTEIN: LEAF RUST 10 DISEASE-RESISTANCE LOCUS RECEPTOR-LIKE PROTEIN KINASE-like 1.2 n=1 Tax=Cryptomeria japonica TaxID=3369 RepID=UPI0027DA7018|nr:LOW QUALITY PROTEIN: LEAF RUST 10 DISEASE-RESISTANCE LOCUS RECEPTOR-LIKE PROTEIN KINASE-like 1.2 [Cryptomeria japonica]
MDLCFLLIALGIMIMFPALCRCSASMFETCSNSSASCLAPNGNINIQFPFGAAPGCGHQDFQIQCHSEHFPTIKIGRHEYRILQFNYPEQSIQIVDEAALSTYCYLPNATLTISGSPFRLLPHSTLYLFIHCQKQVRNFSQINCSTDSYLAFSDDDIKANWSSYKKNRRCESVSEIPTRLLEAIDYSTRLIPQNYWTVAYSILAKGFSVKWETNQRYLNSCLSCNSSKGICGYNVSDPEHPFLCHCRKAPSQPLNCFNVIRRRRKTYIIAGGIGGALALLAATTLFVCIWVRKKRYAVASPSWGKDFESVKRNIPSLTVFSYEELEEGTNAFDRSRELGDGGFGVVYLGKLRDGRTVAVKRLHENNPKRLDQFLNELRILSTVHHANLVRLFGYCHQRQNLLLVYEYVPNGTLFYHLHREHPEGEKGLSWRTRLNIALETAEALSYLHFSVEPAIFHRDVKSTNILLDEYMRVKVADFGLSRVMPLESTHISTFPQGTPGYVDPVYHQMYQLTDKSDVYSFGVVLVELISGKKAVDTKRDSKDIGLANMAISNIQNGTLNELVDPDLEFQSDPLVNSMVTGVAELAFMCLSYEKDDRPCMMEVVTQLQRIKQLGYGCPNCQAVGHRAEGFPTFVSFTPPFSPNTPQPMCSSSTASS